MKRMSAMVLSTICIMNALASPVATAFADTNGYEVVDLSANSGKLMETVLLEGETVSPSTMSEESDDSDEISEEELGDLTQYRRRRYGDGSFVDALGRCVRPSSTVASGYLYAMYWFEEFSMEYTHEMEVEAARVAFKQRKDLLKRVGDFEQYRTYTNADKTEFTDVSGRTVYKTDSNESGWAFASASGDSEYEYTQDIELQTIVAYLDKKEAEEKREQELKALEALWSDAKKKYAYLEKDYADSSERSDVKLYILPDVVTLDMIDFRNYTVFKYESGEFKDLEPHYSEILDFIKDTYSDLGEVSIKRAGIANGKYGIVFTATVGDSEENPLYAMKTQLDDNHTWIDKDMRKTWTFFLPVNTMSKDLVFVDAGVNRLDIKPNQEISDDVLAVVKTYLLDKRKLSSIDVQDKMVKYDATGKYHYLDVTYVTSDSETFDARIRFLRVEGFQHDDDNFYVDFEEGKTKLSEADVERLNKSLGVMKNNIFYDFDIGVLNTDMIVNSDRLAGDVVSIDLGHNADLPSYNIGSCYTGVGRFTDSDSLIYKYKISAVVPYRHDDFLLTGLKYDDITDTDLYVYNRVLFKEQVSGSISLNDYVKSKNGGHDIVKLIRFEQGEHYYSKNTARLIALSYFDDDGQIKYYMVKLKPEMTSLYFEENGSGELTIVDERLRNKIKDVLFKKYGNIIKNVWVGDTSRWSAVNFAFSYMNDKRVAGQVFLVSDMGDYLAPGMCRPYDRTDVMIDVYMATNKNELGYWIGDMEFDDKNYVVKTSEDVEKPKTGESKDDVPKTSPSELPKTSPSELPKTSPSELPKDVPNKEVLTPSELVKEDKLIKPTPSELPKDNGSTDTKVLNSKNSSSVGTNKSGGNSNAVRQSGVLDLNKQSDTETNDFKVIENPSGKVVSVDRQIGVVAGNDDIQSNLTPVNSERSVGIGRNVKTSDSSMLFVYGGLFMVSMFGFLASVFGRGKKTK